MSERSVITPRRCRHLARMSALSVMAIGISSLLAINLISGPALADGTSVSKPAAKTPIKLLAIDTVNTDLSNHPEIESSAKAAADSINAVGGISGHPIDIITCNDQANVNIAASCAREAVSDHVAAVVGSDSTFGDQIDPILASAGIPSIGPLVLEPADLTSRIVFPFEGSQTQLYAAMVFALARRNITRIACAVLDVPQAFEAADLVAKAAKVAKTPSGKSVSFVGNVSVSLTASDYTPTAAALEAKGAQGVLLVTSGEAGSGIVTAAKQAGFNMVFAEGQLNFSPQLLAEMGSTANGLTAVSDFPDSVTSTSFAGIRTFQAQMNHASAHGVANAGKKFWTPLALDTWLSVYAVDHVGETIRGSVTSHSLLAALRKAKNVNLFGVVPPWSPSVRGPAGNATISNPWFYFLEVKNGLNYLVDKKPLNIETALKG
jgi:ABC-type branched-subunit amino acid transport system substrate-binding protein